MEKAKRNTADSFAKEKEMRQQVNTMKNEIVRLKPECIDCLLKHHLNVAPEGTDTKTKLKYMKGLMQVIVDAKLEDSAPTLNPAIHKLQKDMFGMVLYDYTEIKKHYNELMMEKVPEIEKAILTSEEPLKLAIQYAMTGNYIDFGAVDNVNENDLNKYLMAAKDISVNEEEYVSLKNDIKKAKSLVYLTDNCGEVVMDKLFIEEIGRQNPELHITVIVRGEEVLNDATIADAEQIGLTDIVKVIGNGSGIAGTSMSDISKEALELMEQADVLIAKGQGNYETLQNCGLNVYYLFLCKCMMFANRFLVPQFTGMLINDRNC